MDPNTKRLRRDEAAKYLRDIWGLPISTSWLAKAAVRGDGPEMQYFNDIPLSTPQQLDEWAKKKLSPPVSSTAARRAAPAMAA